MKDITMFQSFGATLLFPNRLAYFAPGGGESFDNVPQQPVPGPEREKEAPPQKATDLSKDAMKTGATKIDKGMKDLDRAARAGGAELLDLVQSLPTVKLREGTTDRMDQRSALNRLEFAVRDLKNNPPQTAEQFANRLASEMMKIPNRQLLEGYARNISYKGTAVVLEIGPGGGITVR